MSLPALVEDLKTIHGKKVYFAHQSVGADIVAGLRELNDAGAGIELTESLIGRNGDPFGKCDEFIRSMEFVAARHLDFALMKLCYADFTPATDCRAIFEHYQKTLSLLETQYPRIHFIPVTTPLTARSPAWKRAAKTVLRRPDAGSLVNALRTGFNDLLTAHYRHRPVFNLARVQSTKPNGSRHQFTWDKRPAYSLVNSYTRDGGHLNQLGRRLAAQELVRTLATAVRQCLSPSSSQ